MKITAYLCSAKKGRGGLYRQRSKVKLGIEPNIDFAKKERSELPVSILWQRWIQVTWHSSDDVAGKTFFLSCNLTYMPNMLSDF